MDRQLQELRRQADGAQVSVGDEKKAGREKHRAARYTDNELLYR
jgi:hypothetical protein